MTTADDFDGCSRACRKTEAHTYTWGMCAHAPEPEPRLTVARHVIAGDGQPSIAMEGIPLGELAARIERVLRAAPGDCSAMALAVAKGLIGSADVEEAVDA